MPRFAAADHDLAGPILEVVERILMPAFEEREDLQRMISLRLNRASVRVFSANTQRMSLSRYRLVATVRNPAFASAACREFALNLKQ